MKSGQINALGDNTRPFHFLLLLVGGLAVVLFLANPAASTRTHSVSHQCEELQSENLALRQKLASALNRLAKCNCDGEDADAHPNAVASTTREFLGITVTRRTRARIRRAYRFTHTLPTGRGVMTGTWRHRFLTLMRFATPTSPPRFRKHRKGGTCYSLEMG
jgi:hypothetical protein